MLTFSVLPSISTSAESTKQMNINEQLKLLGFTKEEVKSLKGKDKNNSLKSNTFKSKHGLKLKKKDILHLASFGLTKDSIENLTKLEWEKFAAKETPEIVELNVSYSKVDDDGTTTPITEQEYTKAEKEHKNKQVKKDRSEFELFLCDPDTTCEASNSSYVKLTVSVTHSNTYAIVSNFDWLSDDNDRHVDLFGSGHKEALTIDYNSIFGSWTTEYYDNYGYVHSNTSYLGYPDHPDANGYAHELNRNAYDHQEFIQYNGSWTQARDDEGYTYADFVWSYGTSSSAYANYTHMNSSWSTSYGVSVPLGASISVSGTTSDQKANSAAVSFTK